MLEDLTDDQVAVITEIVIHHGMLPRRKNTPEYKIYEEIADELIEEMRNTRGCERWIKTLMAEYTYAQLVCEEDEN